MISNEDHIYSKAPSIVLDNTNNRIHVAWMDENHEEYAVKYMALDYTGAEIFPETTIAGVFNGDLEWGGTEIALDNNENIHILYCTDEYDNGREIYYTMFGWTNLSVNTLIDDTRITADDGFHSVLPQMAIDTQNILHVTWTDSQFLDQGTGDEEIFYSKIKPYDDDRNGDATDISLIAPMSEILLTDDEDGNGDGSSVKSDQKDIFIDEYGGIHIVWAEGDETIRPSERYIYYMQFTIDNDQIDFQELPYKVTASDPGLIPAYPNCSHKKNPQVVTLKDRVYIVFPGYIIQGSLYNIYRAILSVPIPPSNDDGSGSGGGGGGGGCFISATGQH
jgi:hypothetical protein